METTQKDLELIRLHADSVEDITKITVRQTDGSEMDFLCNGAIEVADWKAAADHIEADIKRLAQLETENKALKARIKGMEDYTDVLRSQNYEQDYEIARLRDEINRLESEK